MQKPGPEKANEYAFEALKQVITLSSAVLALTITFLTDLNIEFPLSILLPISWALLIASIIFAWYAMVEASYALEAMASEIEYAFSRKTETTDPARKELNSLRVSARKKAVISQVTFVAGLIALALLGLTYLALGASTDSTECCSVYQTIQVIVPSTDTFLQPTIPLSETPSPSIALTPYP